MYLLPRMMLLLLLSAGTSRAVDKNWLTDIVAALLDEYVQQDKIQGQFCLAANIPKNPSALGQFLQNNRYTEDVEETLKGGDVYVGNAVVVAKPETWEYRTRWATLRRREPREPLDHAERRVLENLDPLIEKSKGHVLVIYSYLSACDMCTSDEELRITEMIRDKVVNHWSEYAFVFTKLFTKPGFSKEGQSVTRSVATLRQSLDDLANSGLHLENIFRCYKPPNLVFRCYSCSSEGQAADVCVDEDAQPQQGRSSGGSSRYRDSNNRRSSSSERRRGSRSSRERSNNWSQSRKRIRRRSRSRSRG
ncbi:uncharacterized protein LOC103358436 isoform X2 [Stegastes partitus]|uniref:Uncharacterized protein LOC103358436 isoform X2 n=1 Tax=Stegastes partitus TaxID=144197 RepID=A0A9Y4JVG1_9TELE|nr:PREDICTED: uncharacterized protein LOC103358436 isoform X2 [Stegastes partitus]